MGGPGDGDGPRRAPGVLTRLARQSTAGQLGKLRASDTQVGPTATDAGLGTLPRRVQASLRTYARGGRPGMAPACALRTNPRRGALCSR
jgi:hypothetical protein